MSATGQHVLDALEALKVLPPRKTHVERQLGDGPTNQTWLVTADGERYVLRMVKPFAATVGLSLHAELQILHAAQRETLAAPVIAFCLKRGLVLSRYVPGRAWTISDVSDHKQLARLGALLRRLHRLECPAPARDLRATLADYARRSHDLRAARWRDEALVQLDKMSERQQVVCHNDLVAANIIDNGTLHLIDWEYAARSDPLFELAVVVAHHELDDAAAGHFLSCYLGHQDDQAAADLRRWCIVYRQLLALWRTLSPTS